MPLTRKNRSQREKSAPVWCCAYVIVDLDLVVGAHDGCAQPGVANLRRADIVRQRHVAHVHSLHLGLLAALDLRRVFRAVSMLNTCRELPLTDNIT